MSERVELSDGSVIYRFTPDDFDDEQRAALRRHGYADDVPPRGVGGGPDTDRSLYRSLKLRNRVCYLDGIEIDGHEASDLDPGGGCLHCGHEWTEDD